VAGAIGEALRSGRSARAVAAEFGVSYDALTRHARNHGARHPVATDAATNPEPAGGTLPLDPLDELTAALRTRALAGNPSDTREYRLALAAQLAAKHAAAPTRSLATEPEWVAVRTTMLRALEPFPKARQAIADALAEAGV
jgi:hypothetical protein